MTLKELNALGWGVRVKLTAGPYKGRVFIHRLGNHWTEEWAGEKTPPMTWIARVLTTLGVAAGRPEVLS